MTGEELIYFIKDNELEEFEIITSITENVESSHQATIKRCMVEYEMNGDIKKEAILIFKEKVT